MTDIQILANRTSDGWVCTVTVEEKNSTEHTVKITRQFYNKLTKGNAPIDKLVRASFEFLLEREPKESILKEFDLPVIGRYFDEYESEMMRLFL